MITVKIVRDNRRQITGMFMDGHAGYAEEGSDIICAGASTLFYTLANSLERICGLDSERIARIDEDNGDGEVVAEVVIPDGSFKSDAEADRAQVIMETIRTGFITLASAVNSGDNQYIRIVEEN
ncbi:MAG: ribosomal-processing cysteine protease Prp [Saccharofermentans sp.]|nr:ribosomal-processing cysteine protease Prp [Saccharofermentans sp.]